MLNRKETQAVMSYSIPKIGTVLPAKQNVNPTIPNPGATSQQAKFNEWAQAAAQDEAYRQNTKAASGFTNDAFPSWLKQTYPFQPDPNLAPPVPPAALVVLVAPAEAAPVDFQIVQSGDSVTMPFTPADGSGPTYSTGPLIPVCAVPTYTKIAGPNDPSKNKIAQPTEKHGHHKKP
jgi:hypothetical protein